MPKVDQRKTPQPSQSGYPMQNTSHSTGFKRPYPFQAQTASGLAETEDFQNAYYQPSKYRRSNAGLKDLPVQAIYTPSDYARRCEEGMGFELDTGMSRARTDESRPESRLAISISPRNIRSRVANSPLSSSAASFTDASTPSLDMSRETSFGSDATNAMEMMRLTSNSSASMDLDPSNGLAPFLPLETPANRKQDICSPQIEVAQYNYTCTSTQSLPGLSASYTADASLDQLGLGFEPDLEFLGAKLQEGVSAGSRQQNPELLNRTERPLRPKNDHRPPIAKQQYSPSALMMEGSSPSNNDKVAIAKLEKVQEQVVRPRCQLCKKQPQGFRGPHELQRHMDRDHSSTKTMWVCVDNSSDKRMLANCKHCKADKQYGASCTSPRIPPRSLVVERTDRSPV